MLKFIVMTSKFQFLVSRFFGIEDLAHRLDIFSASLDKILLRTHKTMSFKSPETVSVSKFIMYLPDSIPLKEIQILSEFL